MAVAQTELTNYLQTLLKVAEFKDYGPNGLQIQGTPQLQRVAFSVSASRDAITEAVKQRVQALIVHHGLLWSFRPTPLLVGPYYHRIAPLIKHDINLLGYHLPLDAHPQLGNARSLADLLALQDPQPFGNYQGCPTGMWGRFPQALEVAELSQHIAQLCQHPVITAAPDAAGKITTLGIITGGANGDWTQAHALGLDAYLTGEISEHDWHEARESGITMFAAGHHATERFGIQRLMEHLVQKFALEGFYIDSANPA